MIDVVVDKERNLKNLKQIGTPQEENKIYVENLVYLKLKEDSYKEKRAYVLMGHTERMNGRCATFVEAAIPVNDMEFSGGIPRWSNKIWSGVFRDIKRMYEEMIIVGWVFDAKGMGLRMSQELERVHREHFGGVHQLLFLMDSLEKEERFYAYKENRFISKEGFYIYYHSKVRNESREQYESQEMGVSLEIPDLHMVKALAREYGEFLKAMDSHAQGGQYRELLRKENKNQSSESSNLGIAVAVALLMFVIGIGAYENKDNIFGKNDVPTAQESGEISTEDAAANATQSTEDLENSETEASDATEAGYTIPIEIIPGD